MSDEDGGIRDMVYEALGEVYDPEIGLDIVTLALVYDVTVEDGEVTVTFTLTTRGCPMERAIRGGITQALTGLPGIRAVIPKLVWEPRWDPHMVKEGAL